MAKTRKKKSRLYIFILVLVVIVAGVVFFVVHHDNSKTKHNLAVTGTKSLVKASTSTPTPKTSSPPTNQTLTPGGAVDKNGQTAGSVPPSSGWVSSASGDITLEQPSANSIISNGNTISGTANVSTVNFTLTDTSVGLIDQGSLNVVNGKFSGLMEFQSHSSGGKLEVYYSDPTNGAEKDLIEINVNFGS